MRRWALPVVGLLAALAYVGVGLYVAHVLSTPYTEPTATHPADVGLAARTVAVTSTDGLELTAWWVPAGDDGWAALLVHGGGGSRSQDYVLDTAAVYVDLGIDVLAIDLRGHGGADPGRFTGGYQEVRDVAGALGWLAERGYPPDRTVLHGWSMGAATALRAAPDAGVAAVVADSGYADLSDLLDELLPEAGVPGFLRPGVALAARLFLDFHVGAVRPEVSAAELAAAGTPLLIIHGTHDDEVVFDHARRLRAAHPQATFWAVSDGQHVDAHTDPAYTRRVAAFVDEVRAGREGTPLRWRPG